jgi:peroxin-7
MRLAMTAGGYLTAFGAQAEANSVDFNLVAKDSFASASWDGTLRVWSPQRPSSMLTLAEHTHVVVRATTWTYL